MKIIISALILTLLAGCSSVQMYTDLRAGDSFPSDWLTTQTSLEELKKEYEIIGDSIHPDSAIAWERFQSKYRNEYEIWNFKDEASHAFGLTGYVILKEGIIIEMMGGFMTKGHSNQATHTTSASSRPFHTSSSASTNKKSVS